MLWASCQLIRTRIAIPTSERDGIDATFTSEREQRAMDTTSWTEDYETAGKSCGKINKVNETGQVARPRPDLTPRVPATLRVGVAGNPEGGRRQGPKGQRSPHVTHVDRT